MSASLKFQDCTTTQRDCFLDCLAGADAARHEAVTTATAEKHALAWSRWTEFLQLIGTGDDVFLDKASPRDRAQSFSAPLPTPSDRPAFRGQSFRDWLRRQSETPSHVCARPSGTTSAGTQGKTTSASLHSFYSERQFRGCSQSDPAERPEKAITCRLLREIASVRETEEDRAVGPLAVGAFFFAMRSCECSRVSGERRTKLLRLRNIQFYRAGCLS